MHQNPPLNSLLYANSISVVCCQKQKMKIWQNKQIHNAWYIFYFYTNLMSVVCCQNQKKKIWQNKQIHNVW